MKNYLLFFIMCSVLLASCKKDNGNKPTPPHEKSYPITFNLSGFGQTYVPMGKAGTKGLKVNATDTIPVNQVSFLLLKGTTAASPIFALKTVKKTDDGFGIFKESAPAGDYTAIFYGTSTGYYDNDNKFAFIDPGSDTYYKKIPITVTSSGVAQGVDMDRITGQLVLNINDAIPAGVTKITMSYKSYRQVNAFTGELSTIEQRVGRATVAASDAGKTNFRLTLNLLTDEVPFDVTINYYKADPNKATGTVNVSGVQCKTNVRTIVSGNLFTNDPEAGGGKGFIVKFDPTWNTPVTTEF